MSTCVPWCEMHFSSVDVVCLFTLKNNLRILLNVRVFSVDDASCSEVPGLPRHVAYIISVSQKDILNPPHLFKFFDEG